jgi:hypothetical protein
VVVLACASQKTTAAPEAPQAARVRA